MGRPLEHTEERERALLAAATELLREGVDRVTVRGVAERAGTSTRAVYARFAGRPGLLRALYRDAAEQMTLHHEAVAEGDDMLGEITALALAYRQGALSRPHAYALLMTTSADVFDPGPDRAVAVRSFDRVLRALRRFEASGELAACSAEVAGQQLWALVHGLAGLELRGVLVGAGQSTVDLEQLWRSAVATHVTGLRAAPPG